MEDDHDSLLNALRKSVNLRQSPSSVDANTDHLIAATIERCAKVVKDALDSRTVQQCCLCYGGNSFAGPMKAAMECHGEIIAAAIRQLTPADVIAESDTPQGRVRQSVLCEGDYAPVDGLDTWAYCLAAHAHGLQIAAVFVAVFLFSFLASPCSAALRGPVMGMGLRMVFPARATVEMGDLLGIGHRTPHQKISMTNCWEPRAESGTKRASGGIRHGDFSTRSVALNPCSFITLCKAMAASSVSGGMPGLTQRVMPSPSQSRRVSDGGGTSQPIPARIPWRCSATSHESIIIGSAMIMACCFGNGASRSLMSFQSRERFRDTRRSSIFTRARCSASAFSFASLARACASAVPSSACASSVRSFPASSSALLDSFWACVTALSWTRCSRADSTNIPASATISAVTPITTKTSNVLSQGCHRAAFAYSPSNPITITADPKNRAISEVPSQNVSSGFDNDDSVSNDSSFPILGYVLAAGFNGLTGLLLLVLRLRARRQCVAHGEANGSSN